MASLVRTRLGLRTLAPLRSFGTSSRALSVLNPHEDTYGDLEEVSVRSTAEEAAADPAAIYEAAGAEWGSGRLTDIHKPMYVTNDVPRRPAFPAGPRGIDPDAPLHKHVNFPVPFLRPVESGFPKPETRGEDQHEKQMSILGALTGLSQRELRSLHKYTGKHMLAAHQTKKGKMRSFAVWMIVGSPERGLVGIGRGRDLEMGGAREKAFRHAVLAMDYVNRFEQRTVWGQGSDLVAQWRSTKVIIRARPPGFGLQVPHIIHRMMTACGIRDASATIEGSRNELSVMNCVLQILHGGYNPPGFGSGTGGKGRREDKGAGMRSIKDFERQRGRFGVVVDKRL